VPFLGLTGLHSEEDPWSVLSLRVFAGSFSVLFRASYNLLCAVFRKAVRDFALLTRILSMTPTPRRLEVLVGVINLVAAAESPHDKRCCCDLHLEVHYDASRA
jgi:hypothetical protein